MNRQTDESITCTAKRSDALHIVAHVLKSMKTLKSLCLGTKVAAVKAKKQKFNVAIFNSVALKTRFLYLRYTKTSKGKAN